MADEEIVFTPKDQLEMKNSITDLIQAVTSMGTNMRAMSEQIMIMNQEITRTNFRIDALETARSRNHSRANSIGSRDEDNDEHPRVKINLEGQESKTDDRKEDQQSYLDDAMRNMDEAEDQDGRTSMDMVTNKRGGKKQRYSSYQKPIEIVNELTESGTVLPTIKVPPFDGKLTSTTPAAILRFVRRWVKYQIEYKVRVNPMTSVNEAILRKIRHTQKIEDDIIRKSTPEQFCAFLANDLVLDNAFMFFNELQDALSNIPRLKWHGRTLRDHEDFYNQLIFRQERVMEFFNFFKENEANVKSIPKVSGKYGSAKLFLNLIDEEYNEPILAVLPELKDYNFKTLESFVSAYMAEAAEQFKRTRAVLNGVPFSANKIKRAERSDTKPQSQKREYVRDDDEKREWTRTRFQTRQSQALNAIQDSEQVTSHDSDEEAWERQWDDEIAQARALHSDMYQSSDEPEASEDEEQLPEDLIPSDILNNIDPIMPTLAGQFNQQDQVHGCLYYTIYGKCLKGDKCKYARAHNRQGAKDTSEWIIKRLGSNDRQVSGAPKKLFSMKKA
jgi:hypothetical protein